jgi:hypothetical protein
MNANFTLLLLPAFAAVCLAHKDSGGGQHNIVATGAFVLRWR